MTYKDLLEVFSTKGSLRWTPSNMPFTHGLQTHYPWFRRISVFVLECGCCVSIRTCGFWWPRMRGGVVAKIFNIFKLGQCLWLDLGIQQKLRAWWGLVLNDSLYMNDTLILNDTHHMNEYTIRPPNRKHPLTHPTSPTYTTTNGNTPP